MISYWCISKEFNYIWKFYLGWNGRYKSRLEACHSSLSNSWSHPIKKFRGSGRACSPSYQRFGVNLKFCFWSNRVGRWSSNSLVSKMGAPDIIIALTYLGRSDGILNDSRRIAIPKHVSMAWNPKWCVLMWCGDVCPSAIVSKQEQLRKRDAPLWFAGPIDTATPSNPGREAGRRYHEPWQLCEFWRAHSVLDVLKNIVISLSTLPPQGSIKNLCTS